jgi:hypothetical protein
MPKQEKSQNTELVTLLRDGESEIFDTESGGKVFCCCAVTT